MIPIFALIFGLATALQGPWILGGTRNAYEMVIAQWSGSTATLEIKSKSQLANTFGTIGTSIDADTIRGRRLRITARMRTKAVIGGGASLWIRATDARDSLLLLDNGAESAVSGDALATQELLVFIPETTTKIVLGLMLRGSGQARATNLSFKAGPAVTEQIPLAEDAKALLDTAIAVARSRSLWRDTITWEVVERDVRKMAAGAQRVDEVYPALAHLVRRLGDHHSSFLKPVRVERFRASGSANAQPLVKALPENVAYLAIPGYAGGDSIAMRTYVETMYNSLEAVRFGAACGWVLDLRTNSGGNMWPMLGGLRPFLGDGPLGSFATPSSVGPSWQANSRVKVEVPKSLAHLDSAFVAVLTGPRTASSGEAVAVAFKGRLNTRSFGLPTAGLSTANRMIPLPGGSALNVTVSVQADRNGVRYGHAVDPDVNVSSNESTDTMDSQLSAALFWLKKQRHCAQHQP